MLDPQASERSKERGAVTVLLVHLAWCLVWLTAYLVTAESFCRDNDDCEGLWLFMTGLPWMLGELLLAIPVIGATVYLTADGIRQRQDVMSGGSYVSTNDQRPHFGLGDATDAGAAEIHWPSGAKETIKLPAVDRIYTITEGKGIASSLCAGKPCAGPASTITGSKP